jgi:hypothetical protein
MYTTGTALYQAYVSFGDVLMDEIIFAVVMMRPAARVELEVWCVQTARRNCTTPEIASSAITSFGEGSSRSGQAASRQQQQQQRRRPDNSIASMASATGKRTAEQLQYDEELSEASRQAAGAAVSDVFQGTVDFGAVAPSLPLTYSFLPFDGYYDVFKNETVIQWGRLEIGTTYRFRLRITPPLAQGDEAAGRKQAAVYMVDVAATATIIRSS